MPRRFFVTVVAVLALVASACGQEGTRTDTVQTATFPVTVTTSAGEVTIERRPERIVSLSATATEMLFAIEAGEQVVAVDDQSNHPPEAPMTELSGYTPNVEAIASYDPDIVVIGFEPGDLQASLEALGVPVLFFDAAVDLEDAYSQIAALGAATGHATEADALVGEMRDEVDRLVATVPAFAEPPRYYHELDDTFFTVTSNTFVGGVYALAGLENIADAAAEAGSDYPQLSAEYIVSADPGLIFLANAQCCGESLETVSVRPGWDQITAVRQGAVIELDGDVASRWGPRVVDFLAVVIDAVAELEAAA